MDIYSHAPTRGRVDTCSAQHSCDLIRSTRADPRTCHWLAGVQGLGVGNITNWPYIAMFSSKLVQPFMNAAPFTPHLPSLVQQLGICTPMVSSTGHCGSVSGVAMQAALFIEVPQSPLSAQQFTTLKPIVMAPAGGGGSGAQTSFGHCSAPGANAADPPAPASFDGPGATAGLPAAPAAAGCVGAPVPAAALPIPAAPAVAGISAAGEPAALFIALGDIAGVGAGAALPP
jgi:hypothetical protein